MAYPIWKSVLNATGLRQKTAAPAPTGIKNMLNEAEATGQSAWFEAQKAAFHMVKTAIIKTIGLFGVDANDPEIAKDINHLCAHLSRKPGVIAHCQKAAEKAAAEHVRAQLSSILTPAPIVEETHEEVSGLPGWLLNVDEPTGIISLPADLAISDPLSSDLPA